MVDDNLTEIVFKGLADLASLYVRDESGHLLPTMLLLAPDGKVVGKWARGSMTPAEVDALVATANDIHRLPTNDCVRYLSLQQAADRLHISKRTVWRHLDRLSDSEKRQTGAGYWQVREDMLERLR
jgi:predicted DNA-binding protein (UPF0251 family)